MKGRHVLKTYVKILLVILIIIAIIYGIYFYLTNSYKKESFKTAETDMLLVQAKVKMVAEKVAMKEKKAKYIGKPIIEMAEDEKVKGLIDKGIIDLTKKKSKYYVIDKQGLQDLELTDINIEDGYYIVEYKSGEVIYSNGITDEDGNVLYKLSDIEKKKEKRRIIIVKDKK